MNMIERVARALAAEHYCDRYKKPVEDAHVQINVDANWIDYASTARAAIEAMMTPTPRMKMASQGVFMNSAKNYTIEGSDWEQIIRAALEGK